MRYYSKKGYSQAALLVKYFVTSPKNVFRVDKEKIKHC